MDLDAGLIIGLGSILAFFGGVVWLEVLSRRKRRRKTDDDDFGTAELVVEGEESGERLRKR